MHLVKGRGAFLVLYLFLFLFICLLVFRFQIISKLKVFKHEEKMDFSRAPKAGFHRF